MSSCRRELDIHRMSLLTNKLTSLSIALLTLALLARYTEGATCASCDANVEPFFRNLTSETSFRSDSLTYGNSTCVKAETLLQCYVGCTRANGTAAAGLSYLISADISKEAYTLNEWWKVSCDEGCRMADTLVCEHLTYESSAQCEDIAEWRTCVSDALAPYSCDGFCQLSDRWNHAYKLHHELNCAAASSQCIAEIKSCMHSVLAFSPTPDEDINYLMSWEFFYNGGLPRDFRCQTYNRAESCINNDTSCTADDNIEPLKRMMNNAYSLYCSDSTEEMEAACQNSDYTSTSSSTSSTSSSTTTSTTSSTTSAPTSTLNPPQPGDCKYCDRLTQSLLLIASLHEHPNYNRTEFGDIVCGNYSEALQCYDNCTVGEIVAPLGEYVSPELETLHTQIILSCDPTCRHTDLWICENYLTTDDWCLEGEFEKWLECYENGTEQYDCDKACNIAQRRVNTYKVARKISCKARSLTDTPSCIHALNECLNVRYSRTDMNFEEFLTVDISHPLACDYFLNGSHCLSGLIPVYQNDTANITAFCPSQAEKDAVAEIDSYWREIYHHEECSSLPGDSSTTYADICEAESRPVTNTTGCVKYDDDFSGNPCRNLDPLRCEERNQWLQCSASHAASTNCNGLCSEAERTNAVTNLVTSAHCNLLDGSSNLCSQFVQYNCLTLIWAKSQNTYDIFINPTESLMSWCGKVEEMKSCLHDATYGEVMFFDTQLPQACAAHADYMNSLIELVESTTSSVCSFSTWQDACPGSPLGLDNEEDGDSADDACPADIRNVEACPSNSSDFCELHFDSWTTCLEEEGVFSACDTLCTKKQRRAFAAYTESLITCHIDAGANDFCWEYVSNECLMDLIGDRRYGKFVNMHHNQTVDGICGLLDDFKACLEASKTQNVTLSTLATNIQAPCASQPGVIDETILRVVNVQSNGICLDRTRSFSDACSESGETTESTSQEGTTPLTETTRRSSPTSQQPTTTSQSSTVAASTGGQTDAPAVMVVVARISLDADYNSAVGENPRAAMQEIQQQLTGILNVPEGSVTVTGLSPGSVKVDFEVIAEDISIATAASEAIQAGLPPITVNGETYAATTESATIETAVTTSGDVVTPSGEKSYHCSECADSLKLVTSYNVSSASLDRTRYAELACDELTFITDECFANCVDENNMGVSTDEYRYSQALKIKSLWCGEDCPFAGQASCYATESRCSAVQSDSLDGCLMADYQPRCVGICNQAQRYKVAEKINHRLSCLPNVDQACATQVSACFNSFRDEPDSMISFPKLIGGNSFLSSKPLGEICSFLQTPRDCLIGLDFTAVCQDNESDVRKLADKWTEIYQEVVCQEGEATMKFGDKCRSLRNNPQANKPDGSKEPATETTKKPAIGPKGQSSVDSGASQISINAYQTVSILLLFKMIYSLL